ncbi:MAG: hypothetical protein KAT70_00155 [Thermoplasmata archaeon]|nr:hypothetical protein [Thermoplasmata archaeon]
MSDMEKTAKTLETPDTQKERKLGLFDKQHDIAAVNEERLLRPSMAFQVEMERRQDRNFGPMERMEKVADARRQEMLMTPDQMLVAHVGRSPVEGKSTRDSSLEKAGCSEITPALLERRVETDNGLTSVGIMDRKPLLREYVEVHASTERTSERRAEEKRADGERAGAERTSGEKAHASREKHEVRVGLLK